MKTSQETLFSISAREPGVAVFGVQAHWLCFKTGLIGDCDENHRRRSEGVEPLFFCCISDYADVAFLYNLTHVGSGIRLECPALRFEELGDFKAVWDSFVRMAEDAGGRRTGVNYAANRDKWGCSLDCAVTVAWKGETAEMKNRVALKEAV